MTLRDFISDNKMTMAEFGRIAGIANRQTVSRYVAGRIPSDKETMQRIYVATGGRVTANDFYELPEATESDAA